MLPVIILPKADEDSDLFFLYIAKDNLIAAYRFLDRLEDTYKLIASSPKLAPVFESTNPELEGMRWFPVKDFPKHLHKAQDTSNILA